MRDVKRSTRAQQRAPLPLRPLKLAPRFIDRGIRSDECVPGAVRRPSSGGIPPPAGTSGA
jgi:hypothetical protein